MPEYPYQSFSEIYRNVTGRGTGKNWPKAGNLAQMSEISPESLNDLTISGLNLITQAISIYDQDLQLVLANRRFQTLFNLPERYATAGADFADTLRYLSEKGEYGPIDDIEAFVGEKVNLARAFEPHYFERTRANDTTVSIEGNPLGQGGWITVYTDITEIKKQEELFQSHARGLSEELGQRTEDLFQANRAMAATVRALEAAKQELTRNQEQLALLNTMTPAHIAHVNSDGFYTHSNGRLHTILPVVKADIVGRSFKTVLGEHVWSHVRPNFKKVLAGEATVSEFRDEDSGRFIRLAMSPDVQASGEVAGAYILSTDVTEEVSARSALAHARRRELASQLTSGMAHDFSNLLTIIMGQQARLADIAKDTNPALEEISTTIKSAAQRGAELIDSLSLIRAQRVLDPVSVEVAAFFDNVKQLGRAAVPDSMQFSLSVDLPDDRLIFDPGFAQDAVLNLLLNASEACNGEGNVSVSVVKTTCGHMEVLVNDDGPGFSEDALENAFAPFYSTKSGKIGRGMGLTAAFDFAKSCGGTLRLRNQQQGGASVRLKIPYQPVLAAKPGMVLLVDDDDDVRQTVLSYLRRAGHAVVEASSVQEAAKLVSIEGLTHVVTDLAVGASGTGLEIAELTPHGLPLLIITGLPQDDPLRQRAEDKYCLLSKPFDFSALETALVQAEYSD